ncbi:hypothetical protein B0H34DRAFT_669669 [Crassisporium funariophilum]|nr:hypothetical protein B0H34DRAFT_669669 [Crassisporium funariophilum]
MKQETVQRQLEELQLIQCSLLAGEGITFLADDDRFWTSALESYTDQSIDSCPNVAAPAFFELRIDGSKVWFEVTMPVSLDATSSISVKGEGITRAEQELWKDVIEEKLSEISDSEYPVYQLLTLHLLPLLHEDLDRKSQDNRRPQDSNIQQQSEASSSRPQETFHVLFTSHHLISPHKRRSLQQWSSSLSLQGFAKVGYPGVIYAQGDRTDIEEFTGNVKAMQWLALKVRFLELLPALDVGGIGSAQLKGSKKAVVDEHERWKEFQKVGEVVEEMRRIGGEEYVVEMGIGSAGSTGNIK